jgi:hypothetical protein
MNAVSQIDAVAPMSLEEFIQSFKLSPIVTIKRSCEILGCGHSKLYKMREEGRLRIVPRAGGTGVPVQDHYRIYLEAIS